MCDAHRFWMAGERLYRAALLAVVVEDDVAFEDRFARPLASRFTVITPSSISSLARFFPIGGLK